MGFLLSEFPVNVSAPPEHLLRRRLDVFEHAMFETTDDVLLKVIVEVREGLLEDDVEEFVDHRTHHGIAMHINADDHALAGFPRAKGGVVLQRALLND